MGEPVSYYVTADRKRFVPEGDPQAAYGVAPADIDRLGLREALDAFLAPPAPTRPADKRRRFPASTNRPGIGASPQGDTPDGHDG